VGPFLFMTVLEATPRIVEAALSCSAGKRGLNIVALVSAVLQCRQPFLRSGS
jgi:hypothetical protein